MADELDRLERPASKRSKLSRKQRSEMTDEEQLAFPEEGMEDALEPEKIRSRDGAPYGGEVMGGSIFVPKDPGRAGNWLSRLLRSKKDAPAMPRVSTPTVVEAARKEESLLSKLPVPSRAPKTKRGPLPGVSEGGLDYAKFPKPKAPPPSGYTMKSQGWGKDPLLVKEVDTSKMSDEELVEYLKSLGK